MKYTRFVQSYLRQSKRYVTILSDYKKILANKRALVITSIDYYSEQTSQKIWIQMQKSFRYQAKTGFVTTDDVLDGASVAKRVGADCIVAIDSPLIDKESTSTHSIPLVVFPTLISPSTDLPMFMVLHNHDDVVVRRPCKHPECVVMDKDILINSPTFFSESITAHLLSQLLDLLFVISWQSVSANAPDTTLAYAEDERRILNDVILPLLKDAMPHINGGHSSPQKWISELLSFDSSSRSDPVILRQRVEGLANLSLAVSRIRSLCHSNPDRTHKPALPASFPLPPFAWCGPIEAVTTSFRMNLVREARSQFIQSRQQVETPAMHMHDTSWLDAGVLLGFLRTLEERNRQEGTNNQVANGEAEAREESFYRAARDSLRLLSELTGITVAGLHSICDQSLIASSERYKSGKLDIIHTTFSRKPSTLSAYLDEEAFSAEMELEKLSSAAGNRSYPAVSHISNKLSLLGSDFLQDIVNYSCTD